MAAFLPGSLRATLSGYLPNWMGNIPGANFIFKYLWVIACLGDSLQKIADEGMLATFPGIGTPTAIPYIAASRGLVQGPNEPNASFVSRLINWIAIGKAMGSGVGLATKIQAYLTQPGPTYLVVRVVSRNGNYYQLNADRSVTIGTVSWDWDQLGGWVDGVGYHSPAIVTAWWADFWVVVQDPFTHYTSFADSNWLAVWGTGDQTLDSLCPQKTVADLGSIVATDRGEHNYLRSIIWAPDPTTFAPSGYYGNCSRNISNVQTDTRDAHLAYWDTVEGG